MKIDREKAKAVIEAIEEDAESSSSKYTFDAFCKENNLYHDTDKFRNGDVFINCPFHSDADPSLGINESKRVFNCLGCSAGGGYLQFVYLYKTKVLGIEFGFYNMLNEMLNSDVSLQNRVGFSSIYVKERANREFDTLQFKSFRPVYQTPKSYPELAALMINRKCSAEKKIYAALLMQSDIPATDIYSYVFGNKEDAARLNDAKSEKHYDLEELSREE